MSYLHPISQQYVDKINNAGFSLSHSDICDIDRFISRLSYLIDPSLWMVWPLRSVHNAGSGSTVYTFGGFSQIDGTFVGSPTWGNDGINFPDNGAHAINSNLKLGRRGTIIIVASVPANVSGTLVGQSTSNRGWDISHSFLIDSMLSTLTVRTNSLNPIASNTVPTNQFTCSIGQWVIDIPTIYCLYSLNNSSLNDQHNLTLESAEANVNFTIGNTPSSATESAGATIAAVVYFKDNSFEIQSSAKRLAIINLLRTTICKGLAL